MNTQDIRKHVSAIGQKIQLATEAILGSVDTTDYDFENNRVIAVSSNRIDDNCKTLKCKAIEKDMDVEELNSNEFYIDIDSNDYDTDDFFSIISEESSVNKSSTSSEFSLDNTEPLDATIVFDDDVEIFEENNNDPNNNLDSIQSYQEQINLSSKNPDNVQRTEAARFESNLIPGCSKDSDIQTKIREEAMQIHNLLPQFSYETIYRVLNKNNFTRNRVILSLWDLLPYKRPKSIMNVVSDNPVKGHSWKKKLIQPSILTKDIEQNKKEINCNKSLNKDVVILTDTENYSLNKGNVRDTDNFQHKEHLLQLKQKVVETKCNTVDQPKKKRILHPPKLVLNDKTIPSKWTKMNKILRNKNMLACPKIYKQNEFVNNKDISLRKNVFQPNSTNSGIINDRQIKLGALDNYMQYLSCIRNGKQKLSKNDKNFNCPRRYQTRQYFMHSQFRNSSKDIAQYINKNNKFKTLNTPNVNCNTYNKAKCKINVIHSAKLLKTNGVSNGSNDVLGIETVDLTDDNENSQGLLKDVVSASTSSNIVSTSMIPQNLNTTLSHDTSIQVATTTVTDPISVAGSNNPRNSILSTQSSVKKLATDLGTEVSEFAVTAVPKNLTSPRTSSGDNRFNPSTSTEFNSPNSGNQNSNIKKLVDTLASIFPKADEIYLKEVVESFKDDESDVIDFIEIQCKHPTYVTKEERVRKRMIKDEQNEYSSNFNVERFLEIFPNPFQYFEDPNRKCEFSVEAYKFLESCFKDLQETRLLLEYSACQYNLSLTIQALEKMENNACSGRFMHALKMSFSEDISLLRECAFITYKEQIKAYMNKIKKEQIREFEELKKNNELLECQCCYDTECMPSKCSSCNDGHIFCNSCIIKGITIKLAQGDTRMSCFVECNEEFNFSTLKHILPARQFLTLNRKKQEEEVMAAGLSGLVTCPFCPYAFIPPPEDKIFKCHNPVCMKESCRLCRKLNHVPLNCYEDENNKARLVLEEKMTEALVRKCCCCGKPYFKEGGCNKIMCSCGVMMCYICDKQITGYDHFHNGSCPLDSDNRTLNADVVNAVANKTLKYLMKKNPNVQLDAARLLSDRKRSETFNAALLKRVNKITKFDV